MNNKNLFILKAAAAAIIFLAAVSGCAKDPKPTYPDVENVTISEQTLTLGVDESATLTAKVSPEGVESAEVVWSSDNAAVATVDAAGKVNAVAVGKAVITAKSAISSTSGQCVVTVAPADILDAITDPVFKSYAQFCMKNVYKGWGGSSDYTKTEYPAWDSDNDGKLSWREAAAVEGIDLNNGYDDKKIASLTGIEYFAGLKVLVCNDNELTKLDISRNTGLKALNCSYNQLESLDVTKNTALTNLDCNANKLESLDVTNCTALTYLYCNENKLESLDVTQCTALIYLDCNINQLASLDVMKCTALNGLWCGNNQLESLDVTNCTALIYLDCSHNQLESLDVTNCTEMVNLECSYNQLASLDVTNCTVLISLDCSYNQLASLDVTQCAALTYLYCSDNQLSALDASKMAEPENYNIYCGNQKDGEGNPQTLTLTLRDEQKPRWNSELASKDRNSNVDLAGK